MMYFLGINAQVTILYSVHAVLTKAYTHKLQTCICCPYLGIYLQVVPLLPLVSSNDELMSMSTSHPSVSSTGDTHEKLRQLDDGRRGKGAGEEPNLTTARKPGPL
jgi:hypothetical protein